jgi:hypothetical protein
MSLERELRYYYVSDQDWYFQHSKGAQAAAALSWAKASMRPLPEETAAGEGVREPPGGSLACYAYVRCQSAWSEPMTKMSSCPSCCELAAGPVVVASCPPSDVQEDQALLL